MSKEKMQRTFSLRRREILQEPIIPECLNKWPALFDVSEVSVNLKFSNSCIPCQASGKWSTLK